MLYKSVWDLDPSKLNLERRVTQIASVRARAGAGASAGPMSRLAASETDAAALTRWGSRCVC